MQVRLQIQAWICYIWCSTQEQHHRHFVIEGQIWSIPGPPSTAAAHFGKLDPAHCMAGGKFATILNAYLKMDDACSCRSDEKNLARQSASWERKGRSPSGWPPERAWLSF